MFCSSCGNEIATDVAFCPNCGAPVKSAGTQPVVNASSPTMTNVQNANVKKEVFIRGMKAAGNAKYYLFTYLLPILVILLGFSIAGESNFGLVIALGGFVLAFCVRKIFKQSIFYDENKKEFITNVHSHLNFAIKRISLGDIRKIRLRYVKIGIFDKSNMFLQTTDVGKYHVISFDSVTNKKSLQVWFSKDGNMEEFLPAIEYAIQQSGREIPIDRKDELMKRKEFEKELENNA